MQSSTIRELFLDYFSSKEHLVMPSFSLIPQGDPTLLLIGAGMAPLKPFFTGEKKPPHSRVATCQKCVRTPDIERVGHTGRHATFFEMLGNFSFGDYFKEEAISWAWDLVLNGYRLPLEKLWVSIFEDDDEAFKIWNSRIGVPEDRIKRLGKEDNFWEIGLGPCGPCSEIYYDLGSEAGCGQPDCAVGCDCDRFLEIWNLVFTQFSREASGELVELKQKNIDTGAGLERLAMALQGTRSLYETDQVKPLYDYFGKLAGEGGEGREVSLRIVTEHSRGTTFMIADGVIPSNEGRGYVLRRLLRRAVRHGRLLGIEGAFMVDAASLVIDTMGLAYRELVERADYICQVVALEEKRFQETLAQGTEILDRYVGDLRDRGDGELPGELAFKLYDTYGFPFDLTAEILREEGFAVDRETFEIKLKEQQARARAAARTNIANGAGERYRPAESLDTVFTGYERLDGQSRLLLALVGGEVRERAREGDRVELFLEQTPFYAEAGGQVGDRGLITGPEGRVEIENTVFTPRGQIAHLGLVVEGEITVNETISAMVDEGRRRAVCRSHTATHLLHRALRRLLGDHINQAGSLVAPDRLRFDFNHFSGLDPAELQQIEEDVNRMILHNARVRAEITTLEEARALGATAIFDEKYDEGAVRMVSAGDLTRELCGGTHVASTGEIGLFKFMSEESIGSGLRRVEALVGMGAYRKTLDRERLLSTLAAMLNTEESKLTQKLSESIAEQKSVQKQLVELKQQRAAAEVRELHSKVEDINGVKVLGAAVTANDFDSLRMALDEVKSSLRSAVIVLGAVSGGKVYIVGSVAPDLIGRGLQANDLVKEVANRVGGGGGGKPELAQAGGKDPSALPAALASVSGLVRGRLQAVNQAPD